MLRTGDQVGPYILISKLGSGGFGVVWLAERRTAIATTYVALKMPIGEDYDLEVIKREANLWVQASGHPNILPIIEANIYQEHVVIASEYAPDGSLSDWLKRVAQIVPLDVAVDMLNGILAGLEHLHARQIIHRDLKPDNILLQGELPRLADFGIARILKAQTHSSIVAGTPAYMAPETFFGKQSAQTDLWSAGVIFYRMVAGALPYPQTNLPILMRNILDQPPAPLPAFVPIPIQMVINRALEKNPSKRFQTAAEMRLALKTAYHRYQNDCYLDEDTDLIFVKESTSPVSPLASLEDQLKSRVDTSILSEQLFSEPVSQEFYVLESSEVIVELAAEAGFTEMTSMDRLIEIEAVENHLQTTNPTSAFLCKTLSTQDVTYESANAREATVRLSPIADPAGSFGSDEAELYRISRRMPWQLAAFSLKISYEFIVSMILLIMLASESSGAFRLIRTMPTWARLQLSLPMKKTVEEVEESTAVNSTDTTQLVNDALSQVNKMITRVEREVPRNDPSRNNQLLRFKAFQQILKDYSHGSVNSDEARSYAESAFSQLKSVEIRLNSERRGKKRLPMHQPKQSRRNSIESGHSLHVINRLK